MTEQKKITEAANSNGWLFNEYHEYDFTPLRGLDKKEFDRFIERAALNRWQVT